MALDLTTTDGVASTAATTSIMRTSGGLCDLIEGVTKNVVAGNALAHLQEGYNRFLKGQHPDDPAQVHLWSFLRPAATLTITVAGAGVNALPADFGGLVEPFVYPDDIYDHRTIRPTIPEIIKQMWAADTDGDYPSVYALVPLDFDSTTGQRYELWTAPVTIATVILAYRYAVIPALLVDDTTFPLGTWHHSDTLLYLALADWEQKSGAGIGVWEQKAQAAMMASIETDRRLFQTSGPCRMLRTGPRR